LTLFLYLFMIKLKMKKVKAFLHIFLNSLIPNASYYRKILNTRFFFSFKYFFFLIALLSSILIFNLLNKYSLPKIVHWFGQVNKIIDQFPSDLNLFINNGSLITSYNRPYFIWVKDEKNKLRLLLVVDESASLEKINQYQSMALLTKTDLFIKQNNQLKKIPLTAFEKITVNKEKLKLLKEKISFINKLLYPLYFGIFILIIILIPLFSLIINVVYIFIASLIVFILLKLKPEKKYHFKKIFQISLHASTFPLLVDYFAFNFPLAKLIKTNFHIKAPPFPLIFIFFLAIFIFIGAYEAYYNHNHHQDHSTNHRKKTHNH